MNKGKIMMGMLTGMALIMLYAAGSVYAIVPPDQVVQVPEPSTLLLLASGLGGLAWWLRKRR